MSSRIFYVNVVHIRFCIKIQMNWRKVIQLLSQFWFFLIGQNFVLVKQRFEQLTYHFFTLRFLARYRLVSRCPVRYPDWSCSQPTCSKFHEESCDHLSFSYIFAIIFCKQHLWWHILLEVWLIYSNVSCAATRWHWAELAVLRCKQIFAKWFLSLQK